MLCSTIPITPLRHGLTPCDTATQSPELCTLASTIDGVYGLSSERNTPQSTMHLARGCIPFALVRNSGWRGASIHSFSGESRGLGTAWQRSSCRQLHLLSSREAGHSGLARPSYASQLPSRIPGPPTSGIVRASQSGLGHVRSFKKANYVEKIGDNERTEEILESLEVKDDEKDAPPPRQVLTDRAENPSSEEDTKKWSGDITKGMDEMPI